MLDQRCDELVRAAEVADGEGVLAGIDRLWDEAEGRGPDELSPVLERICGLFQVAPLGIGGRLAVLGGAMVENGADPAPLVEPVVAGLGAALDVAAELATAWRRVAGDREQLPAPVDDRRVFGATIARLAGHTGRYWWRRRSPGLSEEQAYRLAEGWFVTGVWALPATTLLQSATVRAALPQRERLTTAVAAVAPLRSDLDCLIGLLAVIDDEPLVVLHRPTGRGYQVTIGGIGDNFQLDTLLAATLSGPVAEGLLEGVRPEPSWLAAATDGPIEPTGGIRGQFNPVDGYGAWIWNEGRPADIPVLDGRRVVVLDPPPYARTWNVGRVYPMMRPHIQLDRIMTADEAAGWMVKIAPAEKRVNAVGGTVDFRRRAADTDA